MRLTATGGTRADDWKAVRDGIDLASVATRLLGPAPGRRGERGRRLWWLCPFHEDRNPSFSVEPGGRQWRCFGCGASGDAAALVMRVQGCGFLEAKAYLTGSPAPAGKPSTRHKATARPPAAPQGMTEADALALVESAEQRLWAPDGERARAYLRGRGISDETARAARLGFAWPVDLPGQPRGLVIPWFAGGRLTLVKFRQPDGRAPKYREVYRDRIHHAGLYPSREAVRVGRPLVITEGEFDALLLGQELTELAAVVTLGSASARPDPGLLWAMLAAAPWLVATDNDPAGDQAAVGWPARARRVPPPGAFKDWTEARQGGVNLRRWWGETLAGVERPALFAWEELASWRWGPAADDAEPGIILDRPDRDRLARVLASAGGDPEAAAEREAIRAEAEA